MRQTGVVAQPAAGRGRAGRGRAGVFLRFRPLLAGVLGALAALAVTLALSAVLSQGPSTAPPAPIARTPLQLSVAAQARISRSIGRANHSYWAHRAPGGLAMRGPAGLSATFSRGGAIIRAGQGSVRIALRGVTAGAGVRGVVPSSPRADKNFVGYTHADVREWYASGPLGLEQGFEIPHPIGFGSRVTLKLGLRGTLQPSLEAGARGLVLSHAGQRVLLYGGLSATDARGRVLHAWLSLHQGTVLIHVNAPGASYPLQIDPFLQEGEKVASPHPEKGEFGQSAAISDNGRTAVIGEYLADKALGRAYIYTRSGSTWMMQAQLEPDTESLETQKEIQFGETVAISGDGNTVIIGGYEWGSETGAVWFFTRSGETWKEQQKIHGEAFGLFGGGLALSEDGNTALVGSQDNETGDRVYKRSGGKWSLAATLVPKGKWPGAFGTIGAMSADGRTVAISAPFDEDEAGSVTTFAESGGVWKQQAKLVGSAIEGKAQTDPIALSSDGNTLLVGAQDDGGVGSAWVFTRSEGKWTQQGPKIRPPEAGPSSSFGASVTLSGDGNTAIISGADPPGIGAYWVFERSEGQWVQQGPADHVTGEVGEGEHEYGIYPHLSRDGLTAIAGGPADDDNNGAFWTLTVPPTIEAGAAVAPTTSGFTLTGEVNVHGHGAAECTFEYGKTPSYGTVVPCTPETVSGESAVEVTHVLSGLAEGTYHYRVHVTNLLGSFFGPDQTATTLASEATASTSEPATPAEANDGGLSATATGGTGSITVGAYGPAAGGPLLPSSEGGAYVDVYRSPSSTFTQVIARECGLGGASTAWWYDPAVGWRPMAASTAVFESECATITITPTSSPSLSELTGTRIKFGGPPGTVGQCRAAKKALYAESKCLEEHSKNGIPDHKGAYEWDEPPVCFAQKKGFYNGPACETPAESSKGKGEGSRERGDTSFTATGEQAKIEIAGAGTVTCASATGTGEWTSPIRGTEKISFSGCALAGHVCTGDGQTGDIGSGALELLSAGEKEAEGKVGYYLVLDGSREPFAVFTCNGTTYTVGGAIEGRLLGGIKEMSTTSKVEFGAGTGQQEVLTQYGNEEQPTKLSLSESITGKQPLELDPAVPAPTG